jgi:arylsulfatase A-like enzyme
MISMIVLSLLIGCLAESEPEKTHFDDRPNFVVIDIDSLRWDRMIADHPSGEAYASNIQNTALDGVFLNSVYAPASWTYPSLTGLLTGQYPPISDYEGNKVSWISEDQRTLPGILKYYGYETKVFWGETLPAKISSFSKDFDNDCPLCPERALNAPVNWLSTPPDAPFFLFIHNIDLHHISPNIPFDAIHEYADSLSGCNKSDISNVSESLSKTVSEKEMQDHVIAHYDGTLHYYNGLIGQILSQVKALPDADNTIVIILTNHGEALFEASLLGHSRIHHETVLRTGLVWHDPQLQKRGQNSSVLSLLDVAPSILERANIPVDKQMDGRSFIPLLNGSEWEEKPVFSITDLHSASLVNQDYKLSLQHQPCPAPINTRAESPLQHDACTLLVDRNLDPYELDEISKSQPNKTAELRAVLVDWINERIAANSESPSTEADEELKTALKERGYWGDKETIEKDTP